MRDVFIRDHLQSIGHDSFPDNEDVVWKAHGVRHEGDYSLVEAEPEPPTVGYPRFRFVLRFDAHGEGHVVGCYALIEEAWRLLFSSPSESPAWRSLFR